MTTTLRETSSAPSSSQVENVEMSLMDSSDGSLIRRSSWFGRKEIKIQVERKLDQKSNTKNKSWFVNKVQTTLTTVKKVVATVPVKAKVAAKRGWQQSRSRRVPHDDKLQAGSWDRDEDLESTASSSSDDDDENNNVEKVPKRLETLVTLATMAQQHRPSYMGLSRSPHERCTRVYRGDAGDAARAAVVALAFERCGEVPHGAAAQTWRRYLSKRLGIEGARDVLRAVLSHEAFDQPINDHIVGGISSRDEAIGRFAAEARLDFAEVLVWLQGRHGQLPQVSTIASPTSTHHGNKRNKPILALFRPIAVKRDAELNDHHYSEKDHNNHLDMIDFVSCRVSLGKKMNDDGVILYYVSVKIQQDETRDYQLHRFDCTFDLRRKALILCQQGLGEVVPSHAPGTILRRTEFTPLELRGPDPGARLIFHNQSDLAEFWQRLDAASQKKSLTNDSAADRAWRLWKQHQDDSDSDNLEISPQPTTRKTINLAIAKHDTDFDLHGLSDDSGENSPNSPLPPPILAVPQIVSEADAAPLMESLGIVDALATAVVRPPRWRAPSKTFGPRVFETSYGPWCRVDFGAATRRGEREIALECALWAPVQDVATAQVYGPVVIYVHGNSSCRAEALGVLRPCCELGFRLCACDLGGSGASGGEYVSLGLREARDVKVVADALRRRFSVKRIIIWGRSMGAVAALLCAGERDLGVDAVVADSPFESLDALCTDLVSRSARAAFGLAAVDLAETSSANNVSSINEEEDSASEEDAASSEEDNDGASEDNDDAFEDNQSKQLLHGATPPPANLASTLASFFVGPDTASTKKSMSKRNAKSHKQIREHLDNADAKRLSELLRNGESPYKQIKNNHSFSPSAWLAAKAAAAVEVPLANSVRAKVAEIAGFDLRSLRAGRATANLGARRVPTCLIASKDDMITPLNHADNLALAYFRGFRERIDFDDPYRRSSTDDFDERGDEDNDLPLDFIVCSGDHNAPRTQRVLLRVLAFLTKYAHHSQSTQQRLRNLQTRFSGRILRTPPWDDVHLRRRLAHKNSADPKRLVFNNSALDDGDEYDQVSRQEIKQLGMTPSLAIDYDPDNADHCGLGPNKDTLNAPITPPLSANRIVIPPSTVIHSDTFDGDTTNLVRTL